MEGEVAVVTGASGGIGRALARALAGAGARVALIARSQEGLQATAAEVTALGAEALPVAADVADSAAVQAAAREVARWAPGVDLLVHGAGVLTLGPLAELSREDHARTLAINYLGVVEVTRAFLSLLRAGRRKSVVAIGSLAGLVVPPFMGAYAASKFALRAYCHGLRQELAPEGFHVGMVHPGPVATAMTAGRLGGPYYPLPPGVPVLNPDAVAAATLGLIRRRRAEAVVPARLGPLARLGVAAPGVVDRVYRWVMARPGPGTARGSTGD
ncbi:MAG: SDR family oxidoreductase [Firmicutes bacterium]|nr:SDR family oxidoreductase [Bacillota bacterium]